MAAATAAAAASFVFRYCCVVLLDFVVGGMVEVDAGAGAVAGGAVGLAGRGTAGITRPLG